MNVKHEKFDVAVCGCGSAGFCAAVSAARCGASVAVIEKYHAPGGILTVLGNNSIDQFNNPFKKDKKMIIGGIGWELVSRLYRDGYASIPDMNAPYIEHSQYGVKVNPVAAAKIMDDMLISDNVRLYYGQPAVDVVTEQRNVKSVIIATKDGLCSIDADIFIDCTGDGDLAHLAGAQTVGGDGNGVFQPGTLRYYPALKADEGDKILNFGDNRNHVKIDPTSSDAITLAEIESRRMMYAQMQKGVGIMATAPAVAAREGRRILGLTTMLAEDYISGKQYADSICYTFWFIDIHRDGMAAEIHYINSENTPTVRLSSMISADFDNLMMAGRCISTDRQTNSAIRVKASCMAMGQAVGAAAAISVQKRIFPASLDVDELKRTLSDSGAIVPGICDGLDFVLPKY